MTIQIVPVTGADMLREFIYLPSRLHSEYPDFVPPLYRDEFDFHNPEKNAALHQSECVRLLAIQDNKTVGRIMGIIFHPWNEKMKTRQARFFQLDCIPNAEVSGRLLGSIENWAREKGMNEVIGSFGFSDKDPQGIQVSGFEYPPVIASVSHQPYLANLVSAAGYQKHKDCVSYRVPITMEMPEIYSRIHSRIFENNRLRLVEFNKRSQLRTFFVPVMELMNQAYRDIFGFVNMTPEEIHKMARQYLPIIDPTLVKIITNDQNQPVAFVIAMANLSEGLRKARGKLLPFGFIHVLTAMRRSRQLDLLLGAVASAGRGRGLDVMLGMALMKTACKKGFLFMDSHLILEENHLMRAEMRKLGGIHHKTYRIFRKLLA